jgi:hypothetical protein
MSEHIIDKIMWTGYNIDEIREFTDNKNITYIESMRDLYLEIDGQDTYIPRESIILKKSNDKLMIGACKCLSK